MMRMRIKTMATCRYVFLANLLVVSLLSHRLHGFEFPKFPTFGVVKPTSSASTKVGKFIASPALAKQKRELLQAISGTENGKIATPQQQASVLALVRRLELAYPPPQDLLSNPESSQVLDGVWYLQYTSPSEIAEVDIDREMLWEAETGETGSSGTKNKPFKAQGTITAAGVKVDITDQSRQTIDVKNSRVKNDVQYDWGQASVEGDFVPDAIVNNRVNVSFDTANIALDNGLLSISFGWIFNLLNLVRLGNADNPWLETTFVDDEIRIGRGHKGTMFVLTREADAVLS